MDHLDKKLLTELQKGIPITSQPFAQLGAKLGMSESQVIERVKFLKERGFIRRFGGIFDTRKLGFASTLVAMSVPDAKLKEVVELVNSFPGVTHNYKRNGKYNIWFTLIAPSEAELANMLEEIRSKAAGAEMLNLPTEEVYKIGAKFELA